MLLRRGLPTRMVYFFYISVSLRIVPRAARAIPSVSVLAIVLRSSLGLRDRDILQICCPLNLLLVPVSSLPSLRIHHYPSTADAATSSFATSYSALCK